MRYIAVLALLTGVLFTNAVTAQILERPEQLKNIDLNLLVRSSLEIPEGDKQAAFKLNEARFELTGNVVPGLDFRIRYRLNRSQAPRTLDNAPGAIDHASVSYTFGQHKKWAVTVGKQSASLGSWEFDTNPTYEYRHSEFISRQSNLFLLAAKLGYQVNDKHAIYLQLHNTYNEGFDQHLAATGYDAAGEKGAKMPIGLYASWQGKLFDKKLYTFWSYNISQYEKGGANHAVAIGNKIVLHRFQAYLDLQTALLGLDYPNIASPAINHYIRTADSSALPVFAKNINYKSAVLRLDYEFASQWFITVKGFYETASQAGNNSIAGKHFRKSAGYLAGLEYKPFEQQHFKIFGYYYNNNLHFTGDIAAANNDQQSGLFALGFLYFVHAFR